MRSYIISSIIKRDFIETCRNPQSLIIMGITVGLNLLLTFAISKPLWVITFVMSLVLIGFSLTSFIVTEEKEKGTLDALLVSPANYNEILIGKLFLTFFLTLLITLSLTLLFHSKEISILHTLTSVPIGALIICFFGIVMGLVCHSQAMLSGIGTALMMILIMPEILAPINDNIGYIARALPTHHVVQIANLGKNGLNNIVIKHYCVLLLTLLVTIFWVRSFIKSASLQEDRKWQYNKSNKILSVILLATFLFSSYIFLPIKGEIIQLSDGSYKYQNNEHHISIPFDSKKFKMKEYRFPNKYIAAFKLIDSPDDYIYLSMKKNSNSINNKKNLEKMIVKIKKKGGINLIKTKVNILKNITSDKLEFETTDGREIIYILNTKKFLYYIGLIVKKMKSKHYSFLAKSLDKYISKISINNNPR